MNHTKTDNGPISKEKKLDELYELLEEMNIALMTTRRKDGMLVTRPMATQEHEKDIDLWFVTNIETHNVDQLKHDPNISIGYYNSDSSEWVSVSGTASISQDRAKIKELYAPDWKIWFEDEGGERDGGPDDPRLALIFVDTKSVNYMKNKYSKPRTLFEIAKSFVTGEDADVGRNEHLSESELG